MVIVFDRNSGDLTVLFVVAEPGVIIWNSLPEPKQIYSYRSGLERPNDFVWILHVCQPFVLFSQVGSRYEFTGNNKCLVLCPYGDRKSTRLNSSHSQISYAVFCLKKKKKTDRCSTTV